MHIFLIRHGESIVNHDSTSWMNYDGGLTDLGKHQAKLLSIWIHEHLQPNAIYTSTLLRAIETTEHLFNNNIVSCKSHLLREVGTCDSNANPIEDFSLPFKKLEFQPSVNPIEPVGPGRECWNKFLVRIRRFIQQITHQHRIGDQILIVCHSGTIEAFFDLIIGISYPRTTELSIFHTGITHLELRGLDMPEPWLLHEHNMVYHLYSDSTYQTEVFSGGSCNWK